MNMKKLWYNFIGNAHPWNLKYRLIEKREYHHFHGKIEKTYVIQACWKYIPFIWFPIQDKEYDYFVQAYRAMKTLLGIPKTTKRVIKDHECVLMLMDDGDEDEI